MCEDPSNFHLLNSHAVTISSGSCFVNFSSIGSVSMLFSACSAVQAGIPFAHSSAPWTSSCRPPSTMEGTCCVLRCLCLFLIPYFLILLCFASLQLNEYFLIQTYSTLRDETL